MSSYRQLLYHLVFRTKESLPTIKRDHADQLYAYITGIIKNITLLQSLSLWCGATPGCTGGYSYPALKELDGATYSLLA